MLASSFSSCLLFAERKLGEGVASYTPRWPVWMWAYGPRAGDSKTQLWTSDDASFAVQYLRGGTFRLLSLIISYILHLTEINGLIMLDQYFVFYPNKGL